MDGSKSSDDTLDIVWQDRAPTTSSVFKMIWRHSMLAIPFMVVAVVCALAFIVFAQPIYRAQVPIQLNGFSEGESRDEATIVIELNTHSELIRSDGTTAAVIRSLDLDELKQFNAGPGRLESAITLARTWLEIEPPLVRPKNRMSNVINNVSRDLRVARNGNTQIIVVSYTATSADLAADIANAYAREYIADATSRDEIAAEKKLSRLQALAEEANANVNKADLHMKTIMRDSGWVATEPQVIEDQLLELYQRRSVLEAEAAAQLAELNLITAFMRNQDIRDIIIDTPEVRRLLEEFFAIENRVEMLQRQEEASAQALRTFEESALLIRKRLVQETQFAASAINVKFEMNRVEANSISNQIQQLGDFIASDSWSELETARGDKVFYGGIYQDYQNRIATARRGGGTQTDLRIVTEASPPINPFSPNSKVILAIAITLGAFLGSGLAAHRDWRKNARSQT